MWGKKERKRENRGIINILTCTNTHFQHSFPSETLSTRPLSEKRSIWNLNMTKHTTFTAPSASGSSTLLSPQSQLHLISVKSSPLISLTSHFETWRPCPSFSQMFQSDALASCKPMSPVTQQITTKLTHYHTVSVQYKHFGWLRAITLWSINTYSYTHT